MTPLSGLVELAAGLARQCRCLLGVTSPAAALNLRTEVFSEDLTALLRCRAFSLVRMRFF